MAASAVPEKSRKKVIFIGLMAAALLRLLFALVASYLISIPGLLLIGGLLLFWVCWKFYGDIKEFTSNDKAGHKDEGAKGKGMKAAIITIIIADVSMSLDNVIAVTAIARDNTTLLMFGIALAILLMAVFATAIVKILTRFKWLSYLGLAFLIYLSADMTIDGWKQVSPFINI
jgi:YjbE family integral membrane protein